MTNRDKANAHDWLNEIVTNPDGWRMFYSDSETKSCAEAVLALLKEQELRVCCLCGYFDTVENRCKYHKHDVDVSEFCSRWVKRNDDT